MTIAEFLLARIAEDEAVAKAATAGPWLWCDDPEEGMESETATMVNGSYPQRVIWANGMHTEGFVNTEESDREHIARWNPARVLAKCEAERRIALQQQESEITAESDDGGAWAGGMAYAGELAVRELASIYADHPDYREEWRP